MGDSPGELMIILPYSFLDCVFSAWTEKATQTIELEIAISSKPVKREIGTPSTKIISL